jgi:hypothetical protein
VADLLRHGHNAKSPQLGFVKWLAPSKADAHRFFVGMVEEAIHARVK